MSYVRYKLLEKYWKGVPTGETMVSEERYDDITYDTLEECSYVPEPVYSNCFTYEPSTLGQPYPNEYSVFYNGNAHLLNGTGQMCINETLTNMDRMFAMRHQNPNYYYSDFTFLGVSDLDTSNVSSMNSTFIENDKLVSLDVSKWDTRLVQDMGYMFAGCKSLTSLDFSGWNTSHVTNMQTMFSSCSKLTFLYLGMFDTKNVTNVEYMFSACLSLVTLNIDGWDLSNVTESLGMFNNCRKLTTIYARGCNDTTLNIIRNAIRKAELTSQVTIITS